MGGVGYCNITSQNLHYLIPSYFLCLSIVSSTYRRSLVMHIEGMGSGNSCKLLLVTKYQKHLRALVLHPEVDADEGVGADDVGARVVRRAVLLQVARHRRLAPLRAVQGRRQRQVLALQPKRRMEGILTRYGPNRPAADMESLNFK